MRNREFCLSILKEYTKSDSLLKHAYAVETCVRAYAEKFGEDVEYWGNVALLHDFDYEMYPTAEEHPNKGNEILAEKGFDDEFRKSIMSHADYSNIPRETKLMKTLFACDELAGFITAVAYVRPSRSVEEVEVKSVLKKMKDKAFARAVNREDITKGAEELGVPLNEHIEFCINAMKKNKELLGL
ncbi:MAG: HAD family hydrolase [Stygiobacter sp. RIFOXYC12_FULL_38_8]|nr:MAG: HAD family hydrolase [Stygiobacter sp. RIFOXYB2_FULL_37_11]OGV12973.1 MAG: HAD family hydrolase [Stygiobacter sp. RIFOXYA2_FULL_38_8]OGV16085.1 MAG: HAD family hydrolase [Stygiobacter sp. RIFOXYC2_FULL_38_25]OGV23829.1 MAG: HAD family hydrolase [Stygiobacter sp. RIFOXYC12_FULL_38_8]OGV80960.1 MAG: HAD family hydrolase [Stygiobacter sp. GWF2_38_21]